MMPLSAAAGPAFTAFAASLVEFIEALTVVLAVGAARGWRSALTGATAGLLLLAALLTAIGPAIGPPGDALRLATGTLSLLFGLRWLRKATLRAAGRIPPHDEQRAYAAARSRFATVSRTAWDAGAMAAACQVVLFEGIEVIFIVAATTAAGGHLVPAAAGAIAALAVVIALGLALHRPLTRVPENRLKFAVGVLMSAFGCLWIAQACRAPFPGGDLALPALAVFWAGFALYLARAARAPQAAQDAAKEDA